MLQKMVLHGGRQSFIDGIGQYSQSIFDYTWTMVRVHALSLKNTNLARYVTVKMAFIIGSEMMDNLNIKTEMLNFVVRVLIMIDWLSH